MRQAGDESMVDPSCPTGTVQWFGQDFRGGRRGSGSRILQYSLTVGQAGTIEAPERIRKGMGSYPVPVVILARLAVSVHYQGRGIGRGLLQDGVRRTLLVSEQAGVRALLTHPLDDDAARFYMRFGFIPSPLRERQLLLLLKDARRLLLPPS